MLAIVAAILFGLALLLDLLNINIGGTIEIFTIVVAGLLFLALHQAGFGTAWRGRTSGWYRRRRSRV